MITRLPIYGPPEDNRGAEPMIPIVLTDGFLRCPGKLCRGVLNRHTPKRCPDCLQPIIVGAPPQEPRVLNSECGGGGCVLPREA